MVVKLSPDRDGFCLLYKMLQAFIFALNMLDLIHFQVFKGLKWVTEQKTFNSRQKGIEKFAERVETQQTDRIRFFAPRKRLPIFVEIGAKKSSSLSL